MATMNVTYTCGECDHTAYSEFDDQSAELECSQCGHKLAIPADAVQGTEVRRCLMCPSTDLFARKDFPQGLGLAVVVVGFVGSTLAYAYHYILLTFGILFATALIDALLFVFMGNMLQCYRCEAQYRGVTGIDEGRDFDLAVHERHRQQEARLGSGARGAGARGG